MFLTESTNLLCPTRTEQLQLATMISKGVSHPSSLTSSTKKNFIQKGYPCSYGVMMFDVTLSVGTRVSSSLLFCNARNICMPGEQGGMKGIRELLKDMSNIIKFPVISIPNFLQLERLSFWRLLLKSAARAFRFKQHILTRVRRLLELTGPLNFLRNG